MACNRWPSLFFDKIGAAGTLMVSCAEHNGFITAGGFVAKSAEGFTV